jgi:hypothetical protein
LKIGVFGFFRQSQPRNIISAPIIYSGIFPIAMLDLWITIYQAICFPLYRVPKVRHENYIIIDRHNLSYLNAIEKLNCVYCGYCGGVFAYAREVAARTEQYWCPLKHARKILDPHRRYVQFVDHGEAGGGHQEAMRLRQALRGE